MGVQLNMSGSAAALAAGTKLHLGRITQGIMAGNHPAIGPATDHNSLIDLAYGVMPHTHSSAEVSNRNIRKG